MKNIGKMKRQTGWFIIINSVILLLASIYTGYGIFIKKIEKVTDWYIVAIILGILAIVMLICSVDDYQTYHKFGKRRKLSSKNLIKSV